MTTTTQKPGHSARPTGAEAPVPTRQVVGGPLLPCDTFARRHIGPSDEQVGRMLEVVGFPSLDALCDATVPESIRLRQPLSLKGLDRDMGESGTLAELRRIAAQNRVFRSFIGMGYHGCITPPVILRNILENPGWYTQYTPYQAEISQGRLEALLNFQTMIADLTGLPLAGASLLDEGTAAAEAMSMCFAIAGGRESSRLRFFISSACHPQTIAVCRTRAEALGITVEVGAETVQSARAADLCGILLQYPCSDGRVVDYRPIIAAAHAGGSLAIVAADPLALTMLTPPGELGADIAVGSAQRFGVPMGYGGPHAAYIATRSEHARRMPGRIIGVSRDSHGNTAYRMAIQTREQHIKREKATSNICTAQALLAIMASMYAVYHGPDGLRAIAGRVHDAARSLADAVRRAGHSVTTQVFFDSFRVTLGGGLSPAEIRRRAEARQINLRYYGDGTVGVALDETVTSEDLRDLLAVFGAEADAGLQTSEPLIVGDLARQSGFLTHPVFNSHHSEHEMLRYIFTLQSRDLSLAFSMIPLGSCTMKLNATSEMLPVTWGEFGAIHPYAPREQAHGYERLFADLEAWLAEITGFAAVSLQPNAGSQGEYAGLLAIRAYHSHNEKHRRERHRDVCLIPVSAHGTNPASAVVAGFRVVPVECDERGNVDLSDLRARSAEHKDDLAALMITYPSTHGVFEEDVKEICRVVHDHGGQVYMDGANMNAQVGLCRPGDIGADVCHLNLHKTFCIPHGGGGPGMGPICVASHLSPFLPGRPDVPVPAERVGPVSSAHYGSASILTISWVYIAMMGAAGLRRATQVAILNANYMARRLSKDYEVLFTGRNGTCAHEFILDCRAFEKSAGIKVDDIAKRLMDFGFHAPTMSFPVPGTLMIEPTESEPKEELDRFCDAMIAIREEIRAIESGRSDRADNPLKHAPHTATACISDTWSRAYPREQGAFPAPWVREHKFWPHVGRIDNPYGDRNLVCTCPPMTEI